MKVVVGLGPGIWRGIWGILMSVCTYGVVAKAKVNKLILKVSRFILDVKKSMTQVDKIVKAHRKELLVISDDR